MGKVFGCISIHVHIVIAHDSVNRDSTRMDKCLAAYLYIVIVVIGTLPEWTSVWLHLHT